MLLSTDNPILGSIPACAGEPMTDVIRGCKGKVYPRVCGGTMNEHLHRTGAWGLSPRVRGNLPGGPAEPLHEGSIPACAGEPCRGPARWSVPRVYPRVCGGTNSTGERLAVNRGLSPRVRGNL